MFDVVLFEFEGVLADTHDARRRALLRSLADDGVTLDDDDFDECCVGFPVREGAVAGLARAGAARDDVAIDLVALRAERYFAEDLGKGISLAPGARALIEDAAGRARLGIVTRALRREVEFVLSLASLENSFDVIVTADDVSSPKPSPEPYERALARLVRRRVSRPPQMLALEDSTAGILSARAVKMAVIAVGDIPVYHAVQAHACIPSLEGHTLDSLGALVARGEERVR
jgi:HAD superfamily hydrolase (TIGR01509 family)